MQNPIGVESLARIHPGDVIHTMDHYVLDTLDEESGAKAYFTVYSLAYMPEVGTGHCCFLRVRDHQELGDVDLAFSETPDIGAAMQRRLAALEADSDVSRGIGTDVSLEPSPARFERVAGQAGTFGYNVYADSHAIEARWSTPSKPLFIAAPRGSFHHEKDITGTMISFWEVELTVDGVSVPGKPFEDEWWRTRLDQGFSSCHLSLGDTAISPGESWWDPTL